MRGRDGFDALARLTTGPGGVWEAGYDVAPGAQGRGLGRALLGVAGQWIVDHGRVILGRTAPWNAPSARLMRSLGMRHVMSDMHTLPAPIRVPPQPLGAPLPGAELRNYYPDWAMNQAIRPRQGG